ncbi:MAG: DUF1073 domain-containing protein [Acutalibacter sp.]|nr:DUF1073 domain-containing protein [Acutalibacter sp.]
MEDNPGLDEATKARYRSLYAGVFKRRYIDGEWTAGDGLIYDMFDPEIHLYGEEERPKGLPYISARHIACDYGTTNPFVLLDIYDDGDPDFGLPEYYTISSPENGIVARVHHSRILRFTGRELPYLERLAELYWGESEVESLYQEVVKHDNVAANMAGLTFRANMDTMEVENLDQLFSLTSRQQQKRFWGVMQAQSVLRSNFGMQLVNKGDKITNTQYSFAGLQEVYDSMCLDLSGASRIPVTKLFGRSPAGMDATGESDMQNYYDYVDTLREAKLRPVLEKVFPVLCMSVWGAVPEGVSFTFPSLWTPKPLDIAEIALKKAQAVRDMFQAGLLGADTAQKELKKLSGETGMFDSITDEEIAANAGKTYQDVTALRDPLMGLAYEE